MKILPLMKKQLFIKFTLIVLLSINVYSASKTTTKNSSKKVYEIALFKVKDATNFEKLNKKAIKALSKFDGYIDSKSFQNIDDDSIILDIVEWKSIVDAKSAQEKFESGDEGSLREYAESISEIIFFGHVNDIEGGLKQYNESDRGDFLEFVQFYVAEGKIESYMKSRENIMDLLGSEYEEFKQVQTVQSLSDPYLFIDLANWSSPSQCHTAQKEVESHPLFGEFAMNIDPDKKMIMQFFKQIR